MTEILKMLKYVKLACFMPGSVSKSVYEFNKVINDFLHFGMLGAPIMKRSIFSGSLYGTQSWSYDSLCNCHLCRGKVFQ